MPTSRQVRQQWLQVVRGLLLQVLIVQGLHWPQGPTFRFNGRSRKSDLP